MMWAPATSGASTNRNVAALPILPTDANINPQLLARLQAAVERIATLDGQRGDVLDAALTKRDLVDVGLLKVGQNGSINGLNDNTLTGGWTNIPYLDSMPTPSPPTIKTGVGVNFLFWQLPNARGVGATQLFRRTTDSDGSIISAPVGGMFADLSVEFGATYFYKIRFVSERGVPGDWSSEVAVVSEVDPTYLVGVLQGRVDDSLLAQDLRKQVAIGGELQSSVTSVAGAGGRNAGFSFGSDGKVSGFYVMADMFAVLSSANGASVTPFIVSGNNTYINNATIKDASITGAKIAEATITAANIASLNVMEVAVSGRINSSNYNQTTKTGWAINQDGSAFFGGNTTFGGKLEIGSVGQANGVVINNNGMYVYDSAGKLRVAIGKL